MVPINGVTGQDGAHLGWLVWVPLPQGPNEPCDD